MNNFRDQSVVSLLCAAALAATVGHGQSLQTLFTFSQPPSNPAGGVARGSDGALYGTTEEGGAFGQGCVFRLATNGVLTDLVDFNAANGAYPNSGLVADASGNLYGTTEYGGVPGYGTIFRITTNGVFTTLTNLNSVMGANPQASMVWGGNGLLYGTTVNGGANNEGTVFQITTNGLYTTLCSFAETNGANPSASVLLAADGNIYGTTEFGGNGLGTVFCLTPAGVLTNLGSFDYLYNGAFPLSALVEDAAGNLYGTTSDGGGGGTGAGTIFQIAFTNRQAIIGVATINDTPHSGLVPGPDNLYYGATLNSLYQFDASNSVVKTLFSFDFGVSGATIYTAPLLDTNGNLYGTTYWGGTNGYGTVFEFGTNGSLATLFAFSASSGAQPLGGLLQDAAGTLYGTAYNGGPAENGTVFRLSTNGVCTNLVVFDSVNGAYPCAGLLPGANGLLYSTAKIGGANGAAAGVVFAVSTNGVVFTNLATFNSTNGADPTGGLIADAGGNLYGTTYYGGTYNYGTVFRLDTNQVVTTLATFNYTNGAWPNCTLVLDSAGYLWGTTVGGGGGLEAGTIFRVPTNAPPGNLPAAFATFTGPNGSIPSAGLTLGPDGAFYGTTEAGGENNFGVVFRVSTSGVITDLVSFAGGNGAYPVAALISGGNGVFYGTTSGSAFNETVGNGTVFRVTTNGDLTTFFAFNGTNGSAPSGPLLLGHDGALYGTTQFGGALGSGTIFKLFLQPINRVPLDIQMAANAVVLTWTNPVFNLQAASAVTGPYTNLPNAFSPYTNSPAYGTRFFRLEADGN